jgi:AbrB family looped-hinge helix DNA binding protein
MQENLVIKMYTKVDPMFRVLIPSEVREKINIQRGQELEIRLLKSDIGWMIMLQEAKSG